MEDVNIPGWVHTDIGKGRGKFRDAFGYKTKEGKVYMNWRYACKLFGGHPAYWFSMIEFYSRYDNGDTFGWISPEEIEKLIPSIIPKKQRNLLTAEKFMKQVEKIKAACIDAAVPESPE